MDSVSCSMRLMALFGAVAVVVACDDDGPTRVSLAQAEDVLQEALCERAFDCDCDDGRRFDTIDACRDEVRVEVARLRATAEDSGLTYDPTCIGALVDGLDALGCGAVLPEPLQPECGVPCKALHGDVPHGGPCTATGQLDDCAAGLSCVLDTCEGIGDPEVCTGQCAYPCFGGCPEDCGDDARCDSERGRCVELPGAGERCDGFGLCDSGSVCDYGADPDPAGLCVSLPGVGGSCEEWGRCAEGLRCEFDPVAGTSTCVGPTADGEPCNGHGECESGNCPAGFCAPLPGAGESCAGTFLCANGLTCDNETERCVEGGPAVCRLDVSLH